MGKERVEAVEQNRIRAIVKPRRYWSLQQGVVVCVAAEAVHFMTLHEGNKSLH